MVTPEMLGPDKCAINDQHATALAAGYYAALKSEESWKAANPGGNGLLEPASIRRIKEWAKNVPPHVLAVACEAYDRQIVEGGNGMGWNRTGDNLAEADRVAFVAAKRALEVM